MDSTIFTPAQKHLLHLMSYIKTPEAMEDLQNALTEYFARRIDEDMDALWAEGKVSEETLSDWITEHMRTPYAK